MYVYQTRQGTNLMWEVPKTWPFDQVTKGRSNDRLKNLYLHFRKVYNQ